MRLTYQPPVAETQREKFGYIGKTPEVDNSEERLIYRSLVVNKTP